MEAHEYRKAVLALSDDLPLSDRDWYLCRRTGLSYIDLLGIAAECGGHIPTFAARLGYANINRKNRYGDNGWWTTICLWMQMFIPQWEARFRKAMSDLANKDSAMITAQLPSEAEIIAAAAKALNISEDLLVHYAQNMQSIEIFLQTQRRMLGVMAESQLWSLIAQGDAPTIRWALPRLNPEVWGDKVADVPGDKVRTIKIIETEGD